MKSLLSTLTTPLQTSAAHTETRGPGNLLADRPPEAAYTFPPRSYPQRYRFES